MNQAAQIDAYLESHLDQSIAELTRLCAQPSVAAQKLGMDACAGLVADLLKARGFQVDLLATPGAPVVFAERAGSHAKTLLFYDHYDVQPPEPLDLWDSPPFEPTLRDGKLYARGVVDNKGHFASRLFAIDALLNVLGEIPCNVKFVIEGEEEISSPNLPDIIHTNRDRLSADACIWEFGGVDHRGVPQQILGMRGICYVELAVKTAEIDAHSGLGGSIFPNAAWRLVWALNTLKGPDERILIPGFYDPVRPMDERDRQLLTALPDLGTEYKNRYGLGYFVKGLQGGPELRQAELFEPTCTICGLLSGYQGSGSKTVLPAQASAKVDFRLVPDQEPEGVLTALRAHLDREGFPDVEITFLGGTKPARTRLDEPFVELVREAAKPVYGHPGDIVPLTGGSGPNHIFLKTLGVPIATAGIAYPGSQAHAPNEHLRLGDYLKGAKHIARILLAFGREHGDVGSSHSTPEIM